MMDALRFVCQTIGLLVLLSWALVLVAILLVTMRVWGERRRVARPAQAGPARDAEIVERFLASLERR